MEIEKTPPKMTKQLCDLVRIVFYMMRKGISKTKLKLDLNFLIKKGKIASKALVNLMTQTHHQYYYSTLSCRSDDILTSFVSPREYEFSCGDSPAYPYRHSTRKNRHYHHKYNQKVFDVLIHGDHSVEASPSMGLPGFGNSPMVVRQLKVTDSPFGLNDHMEEEENHQVDKDAERFIKRFYKELRSQRRIAALMGSPTSYHM